MNEDHIIAAVLAAGMIARGNEDNIQPKDAVSLYELTLLELIASKRAPQRYQLTAVTGIILQWFRLVLRG